MTAREALARSLRETARGKRRAADVAWMLFRQEGVVDRLHTELRAGTWHPGRFALRRIRDPKPRCIAVAQVEDRVVHTALVRAIEPAWMPGCAAEDLACRTGGGSLRAALRLQAAARRFDHVVHLDIRSYFPSVDLDLLLRLVEARVDDPGLLDTLARVLASGRGIYDPPAVRRWIGASESWPPPNRGLPIGAFTSQFLATHVYLRAFDHFVKRRLRVPAYVRYVDDLFLFGDSRTALRLQREEVARWLAGERDLRLKRPDAPLLRTRAGFAGLGYHVARHALRPHRRHWRALRRRIREATCSRGRLAGVEASVSFLRQR